MCGHAHNTKKHVPQVTAWLGTVVHSLRCTFWHTGYFCWGPLNQRKFVRPIARLCTLLTSKPSCPLRGVVYSHASHRYGPVPSHHYLSTYKMQSHIQSWAAVWKAEHHPHNAQSATPVLSCSASRTATLPGQAGGLHTRDLAYSRFAVFGRAVKE